jgi:hypothetical protein
VDNVFFRRAFLLYYRGFMTSDELFTRLEAAYASSDEGEANPKIAIASKLHIVYIIIIINHHIHSKMDVINMSQ